MDLIDLVDVKLCRICLKKTEEIVSIFNDAKIVANLKMEQIQIADMIVECASIDNVIK